MSGFTPTTNEVLEAWAAQQSHDQPTALDLVEAYESFKRWIADHDATVRAEALRDARAALGDWADELYLVLGEESDEGSWIEMPLGEWLGFRADWIEQGEQNA